MLGKTKFIKFVQMQNKPLHRVFGFSLSEIAANVAEKKLCIEVGQQFLTYTISDLSGRQILDFAFFTAEQSVDSIEILALLQEEKIENTSFDDVVLVHNFAEMVLVPSVIYKPELSTTILETIHGDAVQLDVMEDDVHQWELHNVYGWKPEVISTVISRFPQARNIQFSSACLRALFKSLSFDKEQWMKVYFYQNTFHVIVLKDNQLQLAQCFNFETPQDIFYHLLNVVDRLKLDLASIFVEVSGLLDANSDTWSEFNKFFVNVSLEECPAIDNNGNSSELHPSHYFTPFLITPRCV